MHAVVLPSYASVASAGENYTPISPLTLHPDLPSPANKTLPSSSSAHCSFFWFPGYNPTLDVLKNPHRVKIPHDLLCPARFTCALLESLESLSLLFGAIGRHVVAWVSTLMNCHLLMYLHWELCKIPFFPSLWRGRNLRKCMCVIGLEVSCSGNIKRTLGSSSSVQDTVHSYRDKWMWWGREKRSAASLFSACRAWNRQAGLEGWIRLHLSSVGHWQAGWTGTRLEQEVEFTS